MVADRTVSAVVRSGERIYLAGDFTSIGPRTGGGVPISRATGQRAAVFPEVRNDAGGLGAVVPDGSGGWYVGGAFTRLGDVARQNLAHILADGTVDPVFAPDPDVGISELELVGSTLYVAGGFTSIGGAQRQRLAAVDATTGEALPWDPAPDGDVAALAVTGSTVFVGGAFSQIGGQARNRIAAVDAGSGAAMAWNPNASGGNFPRVDTLAVSDGVVYAGGIFESIGGASRTNLAALDRTTGIATEWNPSPSGGFLQGVRTLALDGSTVYVGGDFANIGGQARRSLAALDATTGNATAWNPAPMHLFPQIRDIEFADGTIYAAGAFDAIGAAVRPGLAALDAATGQASAWDPRPNGPIQELAISGGTLYAAGSFTSVNTEPRNRIAALDAATGALTAWNPDANAPVEALEITDSIVYAGGSFTSIGGQPRSRVAALDRTTGDATSWNPDVAGPGAPMISALALDGATLYLGGDFTSVAGQARNRLATVDVATGVTSPWNPDANGPVLDVEPAGAVVYVGGSFTSVGGESRSRIAALDSATGAPTSWNPSAIGGFRQNVSDIEAVEGVVYAVGDFTSIGGQPRSMVAALDASTGNATGWNPDVTGSRFAPGVSAIDVTGDTVYVGGSFDAVGAAPRRNLAGIDAATGQATSWRPDLRGGVLDVEVSGTTVYAGGGFFTVNGFGQQGFAAFSERSAPPAPDPPAPDPPAPAPPTGDGPTDAASEPSGGGSGSTGATPPPAPVPSVTSRGAGRAFMRRRRVVVTTGQRVSCPDGLVPCELVSTARTPAPVAQSRTRQIIAGRRGLTVQAGDSASISITLTRAATKVLRRLRRIRLVVTTVVRRDGGAPLTTRRVLTVRAPRALRR